MNNSIYSFLDNIKETDNIIDTIESIVINWFKLNSPSFLSKEKQEANINLINISRRINITNIYFLILSDDCILDQTLIKINNKFSKFNVKKINLFNFILISLHNKIKESEYILELSNNINLYSFLKNFLIDIINNKLNNYDNKFTNRILVIISFLIVIDINFYWKDNIDELFCTLLTNKDLALYMFDILSNLSYEHISTIDKLNNINNKSISLYLEYFDKIKQKVFVNINNLTSNIENNNLSNQYSIKIIKLIYSFHEDKCFIKSKFKQIDNLNILNTRLFLSANELSEIKNGNRDSSGSNSNKLNVNIFDIEEHNIFFNKNIFDLLLSYLRCMLDINSYFYEIYSMQEIEKAIELVISIFDNNLKDISIVIKNNSNYNNLSSILDIIDYLLSYKNNNFLKKIILFMSDIIKDFYYKKISSNNNINIFFVNDVLIKILSSILENFECILIKKLLNENNFDYLYSFIEMFFNINEYENNIIFNRYNIYLLLNVSSKIKCKIFDLSTKNKDLNFNSNLYSYKPLNNLLYFMLDSIINFVKINNKSNLIEEHLENFIKTNNELVCLYSKYNNDDYDYDNLINNANLNEDKLKIDIDYYDIKYKSNKLINSCNINTSEEFSVYEFRNCANIAIKDIFKILEIINNNIYYDSNNIGKNFSIMQYYNSIISSTYNIIHNTFNSKNFNCDNINLNFIGNNNYNYYIQLIQYLFSINDFEVMTYVLSSLFHKSNNINILIELIIIVKYLQILEHDKTIINTSLITISTNLNIIKYLYKYKNIICDVLVKNSEINYKLENLCNLLINYSCKINEVYNNELSNFVWLTINDIFDKYKEFCSKDNINIEIKNMYYVLNNCELYYKNMSIISKLQYFKLFNKINCEYTDLLYKQKYLISTNCKINFDYIEYSINVINVCLNSIKYHINNFQNCNSRNFLLLISIEIKVLQQLIKLMKIENFYSINNKLSLNNNTSCLDMNKIYLLYIFSKYVLINLISSNCLLDLLSVFNMDNILLNNLSELINFLLNNMSCFYGYNEKDNSILFNNEITNKYNLIIDDDTIKSKIHDIYFNLTNENNVNSSSMIILTNLYIDKIDNNQSLLLGNSITMIDKKIFPFIDNLTKLNSIIISNCNLFKEKFFLINYIKLMIKVIKSNIMELKEISNSVNNVIKSLLLLINNIDYNFVILDKKIFNELICFFTLIITSESKFSLINSSFIIVKLLTFICKTNFNVLINEKYIEDITAINNMHFVINEFNDKKSNLNSFIYTITLFIKNCIIYKYDILVNVLKNLIDNNKNFKMFTNKDIYNNIFNSIEFIKDNNKSNLYELEKYHKYLTIFVANIINN